MLRCAAAVACLCCGTPSTELEGSCTLRSAGTQHGQMHILQQHHRGSSDEL